jgi:hypothetical protein
MLFLNTHFYALLTEPKTMACLAVTLNDNRKVLGSNLDRDGGNINLFS